jgi:hypothetical protein
MKTNKQLLPVKMKLEKMPGSKEMISQSEKAPGL